MSYPHHFPAFVQNHYIRRREQILNFVIYAASSTRLSLSLSLSLFPLLLSNIVLRKIFSNTAELCPSLNVRNQVSHPYKTRGKVVYTWIITFNQQSPGYKILKFWQLPRFWLPFSWSYHWIRPRPMPFVTFRNMLIIIFVGCMFNKFTTSLRIWRPPPESTTLSILLLANLILRRTDPVGHAVQDVSLKPLYCWERRFQSRWGHGCLSLELVVYCVGNRPLRRTNHCFRWVLPCVCVCVCV
jgi:hypothetical protein